VRHSIGNGARVLSAAIVPIRSEQLVELALEPRAARLGGLVRAAPRLARVGQRLVGLGEA
jgi:hypothetical protein